MQHQDKRVKVRDARRPLTSDSLGVDTAGFQLCWHPTALSQQDFVRRGYSAERQYYQELLALVRRLYPDQRVLKLKVFDSVVRNSTLPENLSQKSGQHVRGRAMGVHVDYSTDYGKEVVERYCGKHMARGDRCMILNIWRSIDEEAPVQQAPLALLDARSVDPHHVKVVYKQYPNKVRGGLGLTANAADEHSWYYYSNMNMDECLVFKNFDTDGGRPGVAPCAFHTAFEPPESDKARPRI